MSTFSGSITMNKDSGQVVVSNPNIIDTTNVVVSGLSSSSLYPCQIVYSPYDIKQGSFTILASKLGYDDTVIWIANNN